AQSCVEVRLGLLQVRRFIREAHRLEVGDGQAGLLFEQNDLFGLGLGGLALLRVGGDEVGVHQPPIVLHDRFFAGGNRVVVATERLVGAATQEYGSAYGAAQQLGVHRESLVDPDAADTDATRLGQRLQPRRDVDAVAKNVIPIDDDVADVDADAK